MKKIFRAYDIRGVYPVDLNEEIAMNIGKGIGTFVQREMNGKTISLGYDIRTTSPSIHGAVLAGIASTGIELLDSGEGSFGQTLYAGWKEKVDLIVFITASHLPPEYNGIKMYYGSGIGLEEENIIKVRDLVLEKDFITHTWDGITKARAIDLREDYKQYLKERLMPDRPLKVAVDCGNGAASLSAPDIFKELGYNVVEVFCDPDPAFPNRPAEPEDESIGVLKETVVKENCDLGVAFDGDGDRVVAVDEKGRTLSPDELSVVMAKTLVKDGDCVLANVESSMLIEKELEPIGARVKRIKVGHTFLTLEAEKEGAVLGVEKSGHIIIPEFFLFDDAIVAPLYLAQMLSRTDEKLSAMKDALPIYEGKRVGFDIPDEVKFDHIKRLQASLGSKYDRVNTMDGVRVDFDDGWVLIRASNTSPMIRMTLEAESLEALGRLEKQFTEEFEAQK